MYCNDAQHLWRCSFTDPSQSPENSRDKGVVERAHLTPKRSSKALWIKEQRNPPWDPVTLDELQSPCSSLPVVRAEKVPKLQLQDRIGLLQLIKSCGKRKDISTIGRVHSDIQGLIVQDVYVGTALLSAYARCGVVEKAQEVFEQLPVRDVVSWNVLINAYAQKGLHNMVLERFKEMRDDHVTPNFVTYICILKACGVVRALNIVEDIDAELRKESLLGKDIALDNTLVDMYAKCGALNRAREVFEQLPMRNVVSWTVLITGYVHHGFGNEALRCFAQMQDEGISPDTITYICALKACIINGSLEIGEGIDKAIRKQGLLQEDIGLGNKLLDMYAKCGAPQKAQEVFDLLPVRNVESWTTLMAGYVQQGFGHKALECFRKMQYALVPADAVTYICVLKACSITKSLKIGEKVDAKIRKEGLLQRNMALGNALLDMYVKCGVLQKAQETFDQFLSRDVVSWTTLIAGYVQHGLGNKALRFFRRMQDEGISPNAVTYICALKACTILGSLDIGEDISLEVKKQGLLQKDAVLGATLVDMYVKCGAVQKAEEVFKELPVRNDVSWTAMMAGYAHLGQVKIVLELFDEMKEEGVAPDDVTFLVMLSACNQAGLVKEGEKLFNDMWDVYHVTPTLEHYTCMIDLFGPAGCIEKTKLFVDKVSASDQLPLFLAILGACSKSVDIRMGQWAFEQVLRLDENCAVAYISMKNIYTTVGMYAEAERIESQRAQLKKLT